MFGKAGALYQSIVRSKSTSKSNAVQVACRRNPPPERAAKPPTQNLVPLFDADSFHETAAPIAQVTSAPARSTSVRLHRILQSGGSVRRSSRHGAQSRGADQRRAPRRDETGAGVRPIHADHDRAQPRPSCQPHGAGVDLVSELGARSPLGRVSHRSRTSHPSKGKCRQNVSSASGPGVPLRASSCARR